METILLGVAVLCLVMAVVILKVEIHCLQRQVDITWNLARGTSKRIENMLMVLAQEVHKREAQRVGVSIPPDDCREGEGSESDSRYVGGQVVNTEGGNA